MRRECEVCSALPAARRPRTAAAKRFRRLLFEERVVLLCDAHAERAQAKAVETLGEVRALFTEYGGKRSLLGRRAPLDRRMFPARPEGRRGSAGRRADDER